MRTVTFKSVIDGICRSLGYDPTRDLNAARFASLTEYVNQRIIEGVKFEFWPELTLTDQRWYRPNWLSTENVAAGVERFYPPSQQYYQALQASTNQPPATTTDGVNYTENSAYWAASMPQYSASIWLPNTAYGLNGNASGLPYQVQNPNDGNFYQCIAPHTSGATFDATKFGLLTPFNKYVAYDQATAAGVALTPLDEVKAAWRRNPRVFTNNPGPLSFETSDKGIQFDWRAPVNVWLTYRMKPPVFTNVIRSDSLSYSSGTTVYDSATLDCWTALQAITPGQSPTSNPTLWQRVLFPALLSSFVKRAAFADALKDQKQNSRAQEELDEAYAELQDLQDRVMTAQGQVDSAAVVSYGGGRAASYSNFVTLTSVKAP